MVKPEDKDSSEEDENMNSEQGASTAQAEPASFAELMARGANLKAGANADPPTAILNREKRANEETAPRDWNFNDEDEDGDQEEELFLPPSQKFHPNSIDYLDEQMRFNGLRWRHELKRRVAKDSHLQDLLNWFQHHPAPMDETTRTLAEMVSSIKALPRREAERLMDMGDGNMLMPITLFEHVIFPSAYLRAYLFKLEDESAMPNYKTVQSWSRAQVEARASAIKTTIDLYREQATRDYHLLRSTKERNIVLAHLAHKQSLENLDLNSRLLRMIEEKESRMETNIGADLKKATANLKISMDTITKDCVTRLEAQYQQVLQQLTPYDSEDARRVLDKQVQLLDVLEKTNAALVSENSRLRIHDSFVPIRYREEIERMQQQDAQLYREQRRIPKVDSSRLKILTITAAPSNSSRHREQRNGATLPPRLRVCKYRRDTRGHQEIHEAPRQPAQTRSPQEGGARQRSTTVRERRQSWKRQVIPETKFSQRGTRQLEANRLPFGLEQKRNLPINSPNSRGNTNGGQGPTSPRPFPRKPTLNHQRS
jgi:hypothetical protein